ncbi:MAG: DUF1330 domain-containing protein [Alphaproteobacteria bacterium]|nr:DUF1330 domain-containing protein [Alphaproteobacteria bacterium]MBV9692119.1 DUF1330 domain-containing protein [Alphaproteobacteria bacterium]
MRADISPSPVQIRKFQEEGPGGAIVMVNLLKFRARAEYEPAREEAAQNLTGREAYQRYGAIAFAFVHGLGKSIVWMGPQALVFIGGAEQDWDEVICVRYPSRAKFLEMVSNPDYLAVTYHRDAGLERTALLCCSAGSAA